MKSEELEINTSIPVQEQGEKASEMFSGVSLKESVKSLYSESADLFAGILKSRLDANGGPYRLLDMGSFKGDLIGGIKNRLNGIPKLDITGVDINAEALNQNDFVDHKVVSDVARMPFIDGDFDVAVARYVLPWNELKNQKVIIHEIARVINKFGVIQHAGADNLDTEKWQKVFHSIFDGSIEKLRRQVYYFASANELEEFMEEMGIKFERSQHRRIDSVSDVFIDKYGLNENESKRVIDALGDSNYIYQTTWIISK